MRFWKTANDEGTYSVTYAAEDMVVGEMGGQWLKPVVSVAVILFATTALTSLILRDPTHPTADNLCPAGRVPARHVIVSVDKTDDFTDDQQRALESSLRFHVRNLALGERLTIFLMTPTGSEMNKVLFDRCRPKTRQEADAITENPRHIEEAYEERFVRPFEEALTDLERSQPADYSPILESLYGIAHSAPLTDPAVHRVVELWTDLVNKSSTLNQFRRGYRFEDLVRTSSTYLDVPALAGAEVTVRELVNGNDKHHTAEHAHFWANYFAHAGVEEKQLVIQRL